jgi:uncharacterized membrane protein
MSPFKRNVVLAIGVLAIFGVTVAVLTHLMPEPHKETDYLVIGGIATLISMLVVFVVVISTVYRSSDTFFKKRKKE